MFKPEIFKSYDIRGIVPEEFEPSEAYHIGRAYAQYTQAKKVVVARDMRKTGDQIEPELIRGLTEGGVNVVLVGQATTPMFYYAIYQEKVDGGLMVTASHNPGKYNGIKMTRAEAVPIGLSSGLSEIRDLVEKREWDVVSEVGKVMSKKGLQKEYLDAVCEEGVARELRVVVDCGNGMVGMIMPEVAQRIGGEVIELYWELDGNFPNHEANPLEEENMRDLQAKVIAEKANLGVAFDGDGDRVFFTTEKGEIVPGDVVTALVGREILKDQPGEKILYDVRSSRIVGEVIAAAGGQSSKTKVGHSNIKAQMREEKAVFAGELSGHLYFTPQYTESEILGLVYILKILQDSGKTMSELVKPLMKYAKTPEINFEVEDKDDVLERLKENYSDAEIDDLDGVTISYPDWWVNVRASNTEPLLRLNLEAETSELMQEKLSEIQAIIGSDSS